MLIRVGLLLTLVSTASRAAVTPLCLDPAFGAGGVFVLDVGGVNNLAYTPQGLDLQGDGKLVLGGAAGSAPAFSFLTVRLTPGGDLDPAWGEGGLSSVNLGGIGHNLETVQVQPDGTVVIAGSLSVPTDAGGVIESIGVARLRVDGTLDLSFGDGGVALPRFGDGFELSNAQVRLADGRLRLGGQGSSGGKIDLVVAGLLADGRVDPSFGDGGVVRVDFAGSDEFGGVLMLDSAGRLLVPGTVYRPGFDFGLARLLPSGAYDSSFTDDGGLAGRVTSDFFGGRDSCNTVLEQPDGTIVCGGDADAADGGMRFALVRYLASGALDSSFGSAGKVALDLGASAGVRSLVRLVDGTLVAGGFATNRAGDTDFALVFLEPTGALEARGVMRFDITPGRDDRVHTLKVDSSGRLLAFGETTDGVSNNIAVLRLGPCALADAGLADAGLDDAGLADAGLNDAGTADAGPPVVRAPAVLSVGCACQSASPAFIAAGLVALWLSRRTLRARAPSPRPRGARTPSGSRPRVRGRRCRRPRRDPARCVVPGGRA